MHSSAPVDTASRGYSPGHLMVPSSKLSLDPLLVAWPIFNCMKQKQKQKENNFLTEILFWTPRKLF